MSQESDSTGQKLSTNFARKIDLKLLSCTGKFNCDLKTFIINENYFSMTCVFRDALVNRILDFFKTSYEI